MLQTPTQLLLTLSLILGTIVSLSTAHFLYSWIGMEMNMLSFVALIAMDKKTQAAEAAVKYFTVQAAGSAIFMTAMSIDFSMTPFKGIGPAFMMAGLLTKMGAAPFHLWLLPVASSINWWHLMILLTWQKATPLMLYSSLTSMDSWKLSLLLGAIGAMVGGACSLAQTKLRPILALSSIVHMGWLISIATFDTTIMQKYFIVYALLTATITYMLNWRNAFTDDQKTLSAIRLMMTSLLLMSLAGIPPLSGFAAKWMAFSTMLSIGPLPLAPLIIGSIMSLLAYMTAMYSLGLNMKNYMSPTKLEMVPIALAISCLSFTELIMTMN